ncbi:hypothetical protein L0F63_000764 [Massospora cicadina]|nr:hypothetical protein L0F63_000764 [Massospora cicadina]
MPFNDNSSTPSIIYEPHPSFPTVDAPCTLKVLESDHTTQPSPKTIGERDSLERRNMELWARVTGEGFDGTSLLTVDALLDTLVALYEDCKLADASNATQLPGFINRYHATVTRVKSLRLNKNDFHLIRKLVKGHFGMVSIVRNKHDGKVYAMKTLNKLYILRCKELSFYMEERDVLALSEVSPWIPRLYATFQDFENLYLVMDEGDAKFYVAETVLALADLHAHGYVHRYSTPWLASLTVTSNIPVGTSDYISPEVLQAQERNASYGPECDWWSLGILLYELLQGDPPFSSDNLLETHSQIMNHKVRAQPTDDKFQNHLAFYGTYPISEEAKDLIQKLVCEREVRLGKNGPEEIQDHAFFAGIDWKALRRTTPPFVPTLLSPDDTSNFSGYEGDEDPHEIIVAPKAAKGFLGTQLPFIGFTHPARLPFAPPRVQASLFGETSQPSVTKVLPAHSSRDSNRLPICRSSQDYSACVPLQESSVDIHISEGGRGELAYDLRDAHGLAQAQRAIGRPKLAQFDETAAAQDEKFELIGALEALGKKVEEGEACQRELQASNLALTEERDKAQVEAKQLKRALVEFSKLHQDLKHATFELEQAREQADANVEVMRAKCDSLKYENLGLKAKLERLDARCQAAPKPEDLDNARREFREAQAQAARLAADLQAMTEANQSLIAQIERQASEHPAAPPPSVAIDSKIYNDMLANIELEAKNHHLLTTIYQDLQAQKEQLPSLRDVKESRDEALQRADQMLRLNEKQAALIKSLMDKITYLETVNKGGLSDDATSGGSPDAEARLTALAVENQTLKRALAFKDQKLQEIVTKMVLTEATKPSFWPKGKERSKEKQRVLMHTIQSLEQRLRLVERENSQLRFMNQLTPLDSPHEPPNPSRFSTFDEATRFEATSEGASRSRPRSVPNPSNDPFNLSQALLGNSPPPRVPQFQERSLSAKFGISHIK